MVKRIDIDKRKNEVISLYDSNKSVSEIAKLMNCDFVVIKRILQENKVYIKKAGSYRLGTEPTNKFKLNEEEIIKLYKSGMTLWNIVNHIPDIKSTTPIYRILKKNKVDMTPQGFQKGHKQLNTGKTHFKKGDEKLIGNKWCLNRDPWNKGLKRDQDKRINYSINKMNEARNKLIKEGKYKIWSKGLTNETDERIRKTSIKKGKTMKRLYREGKIKHPLLGKTLSFETLKKTSATKQGIPIEKWEGFTSFEPYDKRFNDKFKKLIKERDGCCMLCNVCFKDLKELKRQIDVHHINYDKKLTIKENCIAICGNCHSTTHTNRKHWIKFFQSLLNERYNYKYSEDNVPIINLGVIK